MRSKKGKGATGEPPAKPRTKTPNEVTVFYGHPTDEIRSVSQPEEEPVTNAAPAAHTCRESEIAELARVIVGEGRPIEDWLLAGIEKAAAGIAWAAQKSEKHPDREKLRKQLQVGVDSAKYLRLLLSRMTFLQVLDAHSGDDLFRDHELYVGLGSLIERTEKALSEFPTGSSPHKHNPGMNSPLLACALAICVAWRGARGVLPPHTSREPQEACRQLWALADYPESWTNSWRRWQPQLQRAKAELANGSRPEVERLFKGPPS